MELSVVTTMYQSAPHLREFHRRITASAQRVARDYELIFVDDGSLDESLTLALELLQHDPHLRVIELSRNFGHHPAMLSGLRGARGARVFLIDCDLEEAPELLEQFWEAMDGPTVVDVVYGVQRTRAGTWFEKLTGGLFDRIFNLISEVEIARNGLHVRLMTQRYVAALRDVDERDLFLVGIFEYLGFRQRAVEVERQDRLTSSYTLRRKIALFQSAVTSFSSFPLRVSFYVGLLLSFVSLFFSAWIVSRVLLGEHLRAGWPSLMASIWFLGGIILMAVGVMGSYVARIYREVKGRPSAIVREIHEVLSRPSASRTRTVELARPGMLTPDTASIAEVVRTEGCVVLRNFEAPTTVERLRAEAERLIAEDQARDGGAGSSLYGLVYAVMTRSPVFLEYMTQPLARALFQNLLGAGCTVHHYCVTSIPPGRGHYGSEVHIDVPRSRLIPGYVTNVGLLLALDAFREENGAFEIMPHSFADEDPVEERRFAAERIIVELDPGDAIVFNARCAHRGGLNRTDRWRHGLSLHACRPYMRQLFDYPRMMPPDVLARLDAEAQQFLGCWVRMPTSMEEWNMPADQRPYRSGQE
jgi:putative glycosyltransferase